MRCGAKKTKTSSEGTATSLAISILAMGLQQKLGHCNTRFPVRLTPLSARALFPLRALLRAPAHAPVSAEIPAQSDRGIKSIWPRGVQIRCAHTAPIWPQPIHLVLRQPQLEMSRQLHPQADAALVGDGLKRRRVTELGHIVAEGNLRHVKNKYVPQDRPPHRLHF